MNIGFHSRCSQSNALILIGFSNFVLLACCIVDRHTQPEARHLSHVNCYPGQIGGGQTRLRPFLPQFPHRTSCVHHACFIRVHACYPVGAHPLIPPAGWHACTPARLRVWRFGGHLPCLNSEYGRDGLPYSSTYILPASNKDRIAPARSSFRSPLASFSLQKACRRIAVRRWLVADVAALAVVSGEQCKEYFSGLLFPRQLVEA